MKADPAINPALNAVLKLELTAINQTFLHARMLQNWGLGELGEAVYHHSIDLMKQADRLIKRILLLEGLPNLQDLGRLAIGEQPVECLASDLDLHRRLRGQIAGAIEVCEGAHDYQSREHLQELLEATEETIDWHETQQDLVTAVGVENYLQSHMDDAEDD